MSNDLVILDSNPTSPTSRKWSEADEVGLFEHGLTFIINDIVLKIPPSQIQINKEDLTYRYRTLRSKMATKVPTGHGQINVHLSVDFTFDMILNLHRLIVQLKNNPFCFVHNRYLRESIVPDWPAQQLMAFVVTSLAVTNVPNASDAFTAEIDLTWFNYFPYLHNWLYREEWQTNWAKVAEGNSQKLQSATIGWDLDRKTLRRRNYSNIIHSFTDNTGGLLSNVDPLSVLQERIKDTSSPKTIADMEGVFLGTSFDLLPMPTNMQPALFVSKPEESNIYVRYHNFLQRDALMKNFGIDVEADLLGEVDGQQLRDAVFKSYDITSEGESTGYQRVLPLHSAAIPRRLRLKWRDQIAATNYGLRFWFNTYKQLELPKSLTGKINTKVSAAMTEYAKKLAALTRQSDTGPIPEKYHPPEISGPVLLDEYPVTSGFGQRLAPRSTRPDGTVVFGGTEHKGLDFGSNHNAGLDIDNAPVFAPEPGKIQRIVEDNGQLHQGNSVVLEGTTGVWKFFHLSSMGVVGGDNVNQLDLVGYVGNTGIESAPHLHLEYWPYGDTSPVDPTDRLLEISQAMATNQVSTFDSTPTLFDYVNVTEPNHVETDPPEMLAEGETLEEAKAAFKDVAKLTAPEYEALSELFTKMAIEGWFPYDTDTSVVNIWEKLWTLVIDHTAPSRLQENNDDIEVFTDCSVLLTGITGSISHVIAHLPILSHEYPTTQFLGSIEPEYQLEFAVNDTNPDLAGISKPAQLIQGMRSMLQSNSRTFRPVVDGYACAVDTFMTRLFGSFVSGSDDQDTEGDIRFIYSSFTESPQEIDAIDIKKRFLIASSADSTVPGNPGLSTITMNIVETNPYKAPELVSTANALPAKEDMRKTILQKMWAGDIDEAYKPLLQLLYFANRSGSKVVGDILEIPYGTINEISAINVPIVLTGQAKAGEPLTKNMYANTDGFLPPGFGIATGSGDPNVPGAVGIAHIFDVDKVFADFRPTVVETRAPIPKVSRPEYQWTTHDVPTGPSGVVQFDIKHFYDINESLNITPSELMLYIQYWEILFRAIKHGCMTISEGNVPGALRGEEVRAVLYDLPVLPAMWTLFQKYFERWLRLFGGDSPISFSSLVAAQRESLVAPLGADASFWDTITADAVAAGVIGSRNDPWDYLEYQLGLYNQGVEAVDEIYGGMSYANTTNNIEDVPGHILASPLDAVGFLGEGGDIARSNHAGAIRRLIKPWLDTFPLLYNINVQLQSKINEVAGYDIVNPHTGITEPAVMMFRDQLFSNIYSCGNITFGRMLKRDPIWIESSKVGTVHNLVWKDRISFDHPHIGAVEEEEKRASVRPENRVQIPNSGPGQIGALFTQFKLSGVWDSDVEYHGVLGRYLPSQNVQNKNLSFLKYVPEEYVVQIGPDFDSPFQYPTNSATEAAKVEYLHKILANLADEIIDQPGVMRLLGIEYLSIIEVDHDFSGQVCYPDMELPEHPYFLDSRYTYPDFYMWNIYDDGQALHRELVDRMYVQAYGTVERCYNSLKSLTKKTVSDDVGDDRFYINPNMAAVGTPLDVDTNISPEGKQGAESAFEPEPQNEGARKAFEAAYRKQHPVGHTHHDPVKPGFRNWLLQTGTVHTDTTSSIEADIKRLTSSKPSEYDPSGFRVSNFEGPFGSMRISDQPDPSSLYPTRLGDKNIELKKQFNSLERMFGTRGGFLSEQFSSGIKGAVHGTDVAAISNTAFGFTLQNLKDLARDSSRDILSQKWSMKRAYPTYKLYFIEEDEFETRFINYDDFHSYNAVKDIRVVQSRKIAADLAVITLQNISGTLDGTKRNSISDMDYLLGKSANKASLTDTWKPDDELLSGNPITEDTTSSQPFGSIVLRPGQNVQLRLGYSNDPNLLQVMISGRVVDLTWNKPGDLAEITVQSFGAELEQVSKGIGDSSNSDIYYTTHQLLGNMMMQPELAHFGRWEFGEKFQTREKMDQAFDFTDYAREGYLGRFRLTNMLSRWIANHQGLVMLASIGVVASAFLPVGKGLSVVFGKVLGSVPIFGKGMFWVARRAGLARNTLAFEEGLAVQTGLSAGRLAPGTVFNVAEAGSVIAAYEAQLAGYAAGVLGRLNASNMITGGWFRAGISKLIKITGSPGVRTADEWFVKEIQNKFLARVAIARAKHGGGALFDDLANAARASEIDIAWMNFWSNFMRAPHWVFDGTFGGFIGAIGFQPLNFITSTFMTFAIKPAVVVGAGLFGIDALLELAAAKARESKFNPRDFFRRAIASIFLGPQDDNIFPPHPKDYMIFRPWRAQALAAALNTASMIATRDPATGQAIYNSINIDSFLDKRVEPDACQYKLIGGTIFDMFHEMSLRHPGWVYGARPYGNRYRYTMFFGLPAQRYWARPASPGFIDRANKLYEFLRNPDTEDGGYITVREFTDLYGMKTLTDLTTKISRDLERAFDSQKHVPTPSIPIVTETFPAYTHWGPGDRLVDIPERYTFGPPLSVEDAVWKARQSYISKHLRIAVHKAMESRALSEYLQALSIRFQPFRRYHLLDSKRDIVWNGIMGSEQAVINAVDVTYNAIPGTDPNAPDAKFQTALFKAHTFIPENLLRIAPVHHPNCYGWSMAQRYGIGELVHRMKDMYRGEIIVVGNARIRPWDICILADQYNNIVGPIEVEQVVHTLSHETGFITEIKPSAVTFANEISGWPLVEAMKLFSLAMTDVYENWAGGGISGPADAEDVENAKEVLDKLEKDLLHYGPKAPTAVVFGALVTALTTAAVGKVTGKVLPSLFTAGLFAGGMYYGPSVLQSEDIVKSQIAGQEKWKTYEVSRYAELFGPNGANSSQHVWGETVRPDFSSPDNFIQDIATSAYNTALDVGGVFVGVGGLLAGGTAVELGAQALLAQAPGGAAAAAGLGRFAQPRLVAGGLLLSGGLIARYGLPALFGQFKFPSLRFLLGGYVLFLQCLRNDAVILVPLIRDGTPIVSGLALDDPAMVWRNMKGTLTKMAKETVDGSTDLLELWQKYLYSAWDSHAEGVGERVTAN